MMQGVSEIIQDVSEITTNPLFQITATHVCLLAAPNSNQMYEGISQSEKIWLDIYFRKRLKKSLLFCKV